MLQLTQNGIRGSSDLEALREEFASTHTVRLTGLLSSEIMAMILARVEHGRWIENIHPGINRELLLDDSIAVQLLHFVTSTPDFLSFVRQVTACDTAASFRGRIYRMLPGPDQQIPWHDDLGEDDGRLVGMSVNLSPRPYSGGVFQIKRRDSTGPSRELANSIPGDAILFRIAPELKHRVTPVEGLEPKTAFAGWFKSSGVDFLAAIRQNESQ